MMMRMSVPILSSLIKKSCKISRRIIIYRRWNHVSVAWDKETYYRNLIVNPDSNFVKGEKYSRKSEITAGIRCILQRLVLSAQESSGLSLTSDMNSLVMYWRNLSVTVAKGNYHENNENIDQSLHVIADRFEMEQDSLSHKQLIDCLETLCLWPAGIRGINSSPTVLTFREHCISRIQGILESATARRCFLLRDGSNSHLMYKNRREALDLGLIWTLLDWRSNASSIQSQIAVKLGGKENRRSSRTFRKLSTQNYVDFVKIVTRLRKVPETFHFYYLIYKFYDLYDILETDIDSLSSILSGLIRTGTKLSPQNELGIRLRYKVLRTLTRNCDDALSWNEIQLFAKFARPVTNDPENLLPEFQRKLLSRVKSTKYTPDTTALVESLCTAIPEVSSDFVDLVCHSTISKSINQPYDCYGFSVLLQNDVIPEKFKISIIDNVVDSLKFILEKSSDGHWSSYCNKTEFVKAVFHVMVEGVFDDDLTSLFFNSPHFFEDDFTPMGKYYFFSGLNRNDVSNRTIGLNLTMIEGMISTRHQIDPYPKLKRMRLHGHKREIISERDGDWESLKFMKFRERFLDLKSRMIERLGGDEELVQETMILPHFGFTDLVYVTNSDGVPVPIPSNFKELEKVEIKRPTRNDYTWHSVTLYGLNDSIESKVIKFEDKNPHLNGLRHLNFNSRVVKYHEDGVHGDLGRFDISP